MKDNLADFNYTCSEHCDACASTQSGTMHHAHDAMGLATPVLWVCSRCTNPPMLVGWARAIKRLIRRTELKARWWLQPRAARQASRERSARIRARHAAIKARREHPSSHMIGSFDYTR